MKVLVFNGSPKRNASDTMYMTRAFLEGMNSENNLDIKTIDVIDKTYSFAGVVLCASETAAAALSKTI